MTVKRGPDDKPIPVVDFRTYTPWYGHLWDWDGTKEYKTDFWNTTTGPDYVVVRDSPVDSSDKRNVGKQFITIVVGVKNDKENVYLGAVQWGYFIDGEGKVKWGTVNGKGERINTQQPELLSEVPPELGHALARWNAQVNVVKNVDTIKKITGVKIPEVPQFTDEDFRLQMPDPR